MSSSDINVCLNYTVHPKTTRLISMIGKRGDIFPIRMWTFLGKYHPRDGKFSGYNEKEIEGCLGWDGNPGELISALVKTGFLDKSNGVLKAHDWASHEAHIWGIKQRNKKVAINRWKNEKNKVLPSIPVVHHKPTTGVPLPSFLPYQNLKTTDAPKNGASDLTPKDGEKPKKLTDVQQVVLWFKSRMNIPESDKAWDKAYFTRYSASAKVILGLFDGDVDKAFDCVEAVSDGFNRKGLSWTPETIAKHAGDWKYGRFMK
jgi:hypothetical protein